MSCMFMLNKLIFRNEIELSLINVAPRTRRETEILQVYRGGGII